jgi:DNA-binding response OmpR family regulator
MLEDQRLLVVDDEEAICEGCRRIFTRQGFQVEKTSDAREGLNLAEQNDYSAILLDIKMPTMTGIEFLESLRAKKPNVPVILMTGYPSVPNAIAAIRLGAAGYVTKPFTPEEISQAVRQHLRPENAAQAAAATPPEPWVPAGEGFHFWHNAWVQPGQDGTARVGAMVTKSQGAKVRSVRLPKLGEVVYQGLPLASLTSDEEASLVIPSPVSGIVLAVNEEVAKTPALLWNEPAGSGWIAAVSPTRLEEEIKTCTRRRVILLNADAASGKAQQTKLESLGCLVRVVARWEDLAAPLHDERSAVLMMDAASFGPNGPALVGRINAAAPEAKIVLVASAGSPLEAAYRAYRIFYYAVEPFADNEISEILEAVFRTPEPPPSKKAAKNGSGSIATINIVNRNGTKVRLMPAAGLLYKDEGLGMLIRQKLVERLFPIETIVGDSVITPNNIMKVGGTCDRVVVLMAKDVDRLSGSLVRDTKSEFISVSGEDAGNVTTLVIQPEKPESGLAGLRSRNLAVLAEHIVNDLASY